MRAKIGIFVNKGFLICLINENGKQHQIRTGLKVGNITQKEKRAIFRFILNIFYGMEKYKKDEFKKLLKDKLQRHIIDSFL